MVPCGFRKNCMPTSAQKRLTANKSSGASPHQGNLGFQSAAGRIRRGEPDRSSRLPSLLVRDQAGCPFDETGRMPVLRLRGQLKELGASRDFSLQFATELRPTTILPL